MGRTAYNTSIGGFPPFGFERLADFSNHLCIVGMRHLLVDP